MPEPIHPDSLKPHLLQSAAREAWNPLAVAAHPGASTIPRESTFSSTAALTSGTLQLIGGVLLRPNFRYTSVTAVSGSTAAVAPTNQWFCVVRLSDRAVLGKTADDTNVAWGAFSKKTLTLTGGVLVEDFTPVYLGVVVVAGTPPNLFGLVPTGASPSTEAPVLQGTSTAALTNPASLGANAAAVTGNSSLGYMSIA